jgi:DNA-binding XRE family transcriptional regulator
LLKRRSETGLTQKAVAGQLDVNIWTYLLWETDQTTPNVRSYPVIFRFLGYDPFTPPKTLPERIAAKRRQLGLSIENAAHLVGVDEGTLRRWESGEWKPRLSAGKICKFLAAPTAQLRSRSNTPVGL